ncbi:MAG: hypothetical protein SNF68_04375 [Rikenellaceae bacterium]
MGAIKYRVLALVASLALMVGCAGRSRVVIKTSAYVADVDTHMWSGLTTIDIPIRDSVSRRDLSIFVKHQPQAKLDSIRVKIFTTAPDKTTHLDTITIPLNNNSKGRRGSAKINLRPYRNGVLWSQGGNYTISVYPMSTIKGVEAVGVEMKTYIYKN